MIIAQCFVEFIFYSFLGWIWESVYCTAKEKKWADRGFLFGPVCPIYGSCVVALILLFGYVPILSDPTFPIWIIFIICYVGSAIAEFTTSWYLEKRFHARWWDYSRLPLNIQGRICVPVSICFGLVGILVVKYLVPLAFTMHAIIPGEVYEALAVILAAVFGADFALTEASLSALLRDVEKMHSEFVELAQANYEKLYGEVVSIETKMNKDRLAIEERMNEIKTSLTKLHAGQLSFNQKRILVSIQRFMPNQKRSSDQNKDQLMFISELKRLVRKQGTDSEQEQG